MHTKSIFPICLTNCLVASAVATLGCSPAAPTPVSAPPPPPSASAAPATTASAAADAASSSPQMAPPTILTGMGLLAPESVLHDAEQDVYFVSNVNGKPLDKDGNGFISKVSPDGKLIELKFIAGGQKGVSLDAPKGMAIVGGLLYVTDITWVRIFDRKTGAPQGKLFVKGATFLNDLAADANGKLYVTDTGWKAGEKDFEGTGTDALFAIDPKVVTPKKILGDPQLGNPNGVAVAKDGPWVVSASGELYPVRDGKKGQATKLPSGALDGLVALEDGTFLVSSWASSSVYRGKPGGTFEAIIENAKSPADIGYDAKRHRLLMPQMMEDSLRFYQLPAGGSPSMPPPEPEQKPTPDPAQPTPAPAQPAAAPAK